MVHTGSYYFKWVQNVIRVERRLQHFRQCNFFFSFRILHKVRFQETNPMLRADAAAFRRDPFIQGGFVPVMILWVVVSGDHVQMRVSVPWAAGKKSSIRATECLRIIYVKYIDFTQVSEASDLDNIFLVLEQILQKIYASVERFQRYGHVVRVQMTDSSQRDRKVFA